MSIAASGSVPMQSYYELLRRTSRTFAVGIEALPNPLRDAVTLAYLVLRVSDYFEDSPTLPATEKERCLEAWARMLAGDGHGHSELLKDLMDAVADADRELPDQLAARRADRILAGLEALPSALRDPIRHHTIRTTVGMARWVRRGDDFPDEAALDDYMFEVAGRVGLLLTDLFAAHAPSVARRREELRETAVSFGLGLQTVNVIRGLHEDPERGWTYVPRQVLPTPSRPSERLPDLRNAGPDQKAHVLDFLVRKAASHIDDALVYCRRLPRRQRGMRIFCIIPALLALRTAELSDGNDEVFRTAVKVPRHEVARVVASARLLFFSNAWLDRHRRRARTLSAPGVDRPAPDRPG